LAWFLSVTGITCTRDNGTATERQNPHFFLMKRLITRRESGGFRWTGEEPRSLASLGMTTIGDSG